ncbi:MAG TPA: hypothetical protein VF752_06930 [Thermoleophilaceae bacterium]
MSGLARLRRGLVPALVALLALLCATSAVAATRKSHKVNATITAAPLTAANGVTTVTGIVTGKPFPGEGAVVYRVKTGATGTITANVTVFTRNGIVKGSTVATVTPGANNTSTLTGTAKVASGTGNFAGATGKDLKVTGTIDADGVLHVNVTGSIKY